MKHTLFRLFALMALAVTSSVSQAQGLQLATSLGSVPTSGAGAGAGAGTSVSASPSAGAAAQTGNQSITFNSSTPEHQTVTYGGTQTIKNVPSMAAPNLTTSNDTCMGSTGGSVGVAGFGGSFGTTHVDENCITWKSGIGFWNQGFRATAIARECQDLKNRQALREAGDSCIFLWGKEVVTEYDKNGLPVPYEVQLANIKRLTGGAVTSTDNTTPASTDGNEPTDPFIRYREGLPPLPGQENEVPFKK